MGYLAPVEAVVMRAMAEVLMPPPPADIGKWAVDHLEFDEGSPFAGRYDPSRFPMLARIHECHGPEHPAREVLHARPGRDAVPVPF